MIAIGNERDLTLLASRKGGIVLIGMSSTPAFSKEAPGRTDLSPSNHGTQMDPPQQTAVWTGRCHNSPYSLSQSELTKMYLIEHFNPKLKNSHSSQVHIILSLGRLHVASQNKS